MNPEHFFFELTEAFSLVSSNKDLASVISRFCKRFDVESYLLGASIYENLSAAPTMQVLNGYPEGWWTWYEDNKYLKDDLTVAHCKSSTIPIIWPQTYKDISPANINLFREASEIGLKSGVSFPYHGLGCEFGIFSTSASSDYHKSQLRKASTQFALQVLGAFAFDFLTKKSKKENVKKLTCRERECLKWVSAGKSSWETSAILGISERTVVFHIQNAASKMNTTSRTNAAIIALKNGII